MAKNKNKRFSDESLDWIHTCMGIVSYFNSKQDGSKLIIDKTTGHKTIEREKVPLGGLEEGLYDLCLKTVTELILIDSGAYKPIKEPKLSKKERKQKEIAEIVQEFEDMENDNK